MACRQGHVLAEANKVTADDLCELPFVDRLSCQFHSQITAYFADQEVLMRPRFKAEREDWAQEMVASSDAIAIMPERSAVDAGITTHAVEGLDLFRDVSFITISGSGIPVEMRQIFKMAGDYDWSIH